MPVQLQPEIFSGSTSAVGELDCINSRLTKHYASMLKRGEAPIRMMLGSLNIKAASAGAVVLPKSLKPFVRQSLSRVTNVFNKYDSGSATGYSWNSYKDLLVNSGQIPVQNIMSAMVKPEFVLEGSLYHAQAVKNAELDATLLLAGVNGRVEAFDLYFQFWLVDTSAMAELHSVSLKLRLYSSSEGQSVFVLIGDEDLIDGSQAFQQVSRVGYGIQWITDKAVARLIGELSEQLFNESFCAGCVDMQTGIQRAPDQSNQNKTKQLKIYKDRDGYCVKNLAGATDVIWQQYRSGRILIEPRLAKKVENRIKVECLPYGAIYDGAHYIEVSLKDADKTLLSSGLAVIE